MTVHALTLMTVQTAASFLSTGLELAAALGLPVTTWRTGDPTRSLYKFLAEALAERDGQSAEFVKAAWLSTAAGDWLEIVAAEVFGVAKTQADYSTPTVTVINNGGGVFDLAAGDVTFQSTESGVTFLSTSPPYDGLGPVVLSPGITATFDLVADVAGSDGSVSINEIDALVTTLPGVEILSSTVALANDAQSDEELREQCRDSRGALSPDGARDAYAYVAKNTELTGLTGITRARATGVRATGSVTLLIAGPSGPVPEAAIAAVQAAVEYWAEPLTVKVTTENAEALAVDMVVVVGKNETNGSSDADITNAIESAIVILFAATRIGGVDGVISESKLHAAIHAVIPGGFDSVSVVTGQDGLGQDMSEVVLTSVQVPVLASLSVTVQ